MLRLVIERRGHYTVEAVAL